MNLLTGSFCQVYLYIQLLDNYTFLVDRSHDILKKIPGNANLSSYDIGDDVEWLDAQLLAYLDRNRDIIEKILFQMHSVYDD
jgi:hypothetical protein